MPLVVPLLRVSLLFLNVYETYKTLKFPRLSSRTGELSARAMSQRKRDMKGCLAVWLVWCCCAIFERNFDAVLDVFLPFYNEFKALVFLFQLLARARGAEPIYLHIIRPLVKPYTSTLDWTLDAAHTLGDFAVLLFCLPFTIFLEWWYPPNDASIPGARSIPIRRETSAESRVRARAILLDIDEAQAKLRERHKLSGNRAQGPAVVGVRTRRQASDVRANAVAAHSGSIPDHKPSRRAPTREDRTSGNQSGSAGSRSERPIALPTLPAQSGRPRTSQSRLPPDYEVWHPPPPAYNAAEQHLRSRRQDHHISFPQRDIMEASTSQAGDVRTSDPLLPPNTATPEETTITMIEDWRIYPPFPSAYPPTPLPVAKSLSDSSDSSAPTRLRTVNERLSPPDPLPPLSLVMPNETAATEIEEWRTYLPFPSAYPPTPLSAGRSLPGTGNSLPSSRLRSVSEHDAIEVDGISRLAMDASREMVNASEEDKRVHPASSSQSLPSRTRARRNVRSRHADYLERMDVDSAQNRDGLDFGLSLKRPRESHETEDSGSLRGLSDRKVITDTELSLRSRIVREAAGGKGEEPANHGGLDHTGQGVVKASQVSDRPLLRARVLATTRNSGSRAPQTSTAPSTSMASSMSSRNNSRSTALTTISRGSSLRTLSSKPSNASESVSSSLGSIDELEPDDVPPITGRKRTLSRIAGAENVRSKRAATAKTRTTLSGKPSEGKKLQVPTRIMDSATSTQGPKTRGGAQKRDTDKLESSAEESSGLDVANGKVPVKKRRRVAPMERTNLPSDSGNVRTTRQTRAQLSKT